MQIINLSAGNLIFIPSCFILEGITSLQVWSKIRKDGCMMADKFSQITPQIEHYTKLCMSNGPIDPQLYQQYDVKRGLRDLDGKGVLTGLTEISDIVSKKQENGKMVPCEGKLYYRGVDVEEMVRGFVSEKRFGFEEATYLLLFGNLPNREQLDEFCGVLADYRTLPTSFVRDIIMKAIAIMFSPSSFT